MSRSSRNRNSNNVKVALVWFNPRQSCKIRFGRLYASIMLSTLLHCLSKGNRYTRVQGRRRCAASVECQAASHLFLSSAADVFCKESTIKSCCHIFHALKNASHVKGPAAHARVCRADAGCAETGCSRLRLSPPKSYFLLC